MFIFIENLTWHGFRTNAERKRDWKGWVFKFNAGSQNNGGERNYANCQIVKIVGLTPSVFTVKPRRLSIFYFSFSFFLQSLSKSWFCLCLSVLYLSLHVKLKRSLAFSFDKLFSFSFYSNVGWILSLFSFLLNVAWM